MENYITLKECLYKLIHKKTYRDNFLAGQFSLLQLKENDIEHLSTIDKAELIKTAEKTKKYLIKGNTSNSGGLSFLFPTTIEILKNQLGIDISNFTDIFLESVFFDAYTEIPYAGKGICLPEAFHLFISDYFSENEKGKNIIQLSKFELCNALYSIILINRNFNFEIKSPNLVNKNKDIYWTTLDMSDEIMQLNLPQNVTEGIYLFCINSDHKIIKGHIDPTIKKLISYQNLRNIQCNIDEITNADLSSSSLKALTDLLLKKKMIYEDF